MTWQRWLIAIGIAGCVVGAILQAHSGPSKDCHYDYQHSFAGREHTESESDYCKHWGQVPFPQNT